jgi:predicted nucleic acid-binding protein
MPAKVIDASVLAAMAFGESRAEEAKALITGFDLAAPDFLPYEMCSVGCKKIRRRLAESDAVKAALASIFDLRISFHAIPIVSLLSLALNSGLSAYDAAYLHLARSLGCELATFDERLARAAV